MSTSDAGYHNGGGVLKNTWYNAKVKTAAAAGATSVPAWHATAGSALIPDSFGVYTTITNWVAEAGNPDGSLGTAIFTAPTDDVYSFSAFGIFDNASADTGIYSLQIYELANGGVIADSGNSQKYGLPMPLTATGVIFMPTGYTIEARVTQNSGVAALLERMRFTVVKLSG
jgi:hypothetical protein